MLSLYSPRPRQTLRIYCGPLLSQRDPFINHLIQVIDLSIKYLERTLNYGAFVPDIKDIYVAYDVFPLPVVDLLA